MSLAQKLEQDNLRSVCQRSVEELHSLFVAWFQGTQDREGLSTQLLDCLAPDFSHVAPNGQFLQGRSILLSHLHDKYGCYQNRLFQIEIYDVKLLWSDPTGDKCLCTYEEWQSWLPEKEEGPEDPDADDDDEEDSDQSMEPPTRQQPSSQDEVHQFGRLSTCLLERKQVEPTDPSVGKYRWIHVHETWLEADSPQHERAVPDDAKSAYLEEETIMTGPVEYHKMIADRQPPSMLENTSSQEEDDDDDDAGGDASNEAESSDGSSSSDEEDEGPMKAQPSTDEDSEDEGPAPVAAAAAVAAAGVLQSTSGDSSDDDDENPEESGSPFDRHLLMLMSNQALSRDQVTRQNEARNILESTGIAFYELDGANPEERENRNSLFALSGKWGVYPMFFLVDTAGSTTYWGDFEKFQTSHAAGTLEEDINQPDDTEDEETETESSMPPLPPAAMEAAKEARSASPPPSVSAASDSSSSDADEGPVQETTSAAAATTATMVDPENMPEKATNCQLILLMSSQTLSRDQKTHQEEAARVLAQYKIEHVVVDGSVKQNRERRNQLFRTSTYWGKYFQLFHENKETGTRSYWGAWDELETSMMRNTVVRDLQYVSLPPAPIEGGQEASPDSTARAPTNAATASSSDDGSESSESDAKPAVAVAATTAAVAATAATAAVVAKAPSGKFNFEKNVVLLLSNQSLSRDQMNRQAHAREYMECVDYMELDGAAKENRQTRNELFKISKLWGRYPQVFLIKPGTDDPIFFGDWERIETLHENGTLEEEITAVVGSVDESSDSDSDSEESLNIAEGLQSAAPASQSGSQSGLQGSGRLNVGDKKVVDLDPNSAEPKSQEELFLERSSGILHFENEGEEDEKEISKKDDDGASLTEEERLKQVTSTLSPIPQDASSKRHVSSKLLKHAKPLTWANTLVGLSINGFDIGTSQGPLADDMWYKEVTEALEIVSQYKRPGVIHGKRKLALPETVYPTAHVALEGHGFWLSWDVLDAMEEWARAHSEIEVLSSNKNKGVSVMKSIDGKKFWEEKNTLQNTSSSSVCHFDWTYSTPFPGKVEGGTWTELDESGMRAELLTDTSVPILFFDDVTMFQDNLQNHGQVEYSAKLRVMPSCAYVLARLYVVVDHVVVRVRESRLLVDFFGLKPAIYRDVTWRECAWRDLKSVGLSTDPKTLHFDGKESADWQTMLRKIPEVDPPPGVMRYAVLEAPPQGSKSKAALTPSRGPNDDGSVGYLEV